MKRDVRNDIINMLIKNGYLFTGNFEESHYYFANDKVMVCYVTPHEGNGFKHMIRAEIIEDFDRWSNAQFEEFIDEVDELVSLIFILNDLESVEDDD